jgi:diguanylate cyclase (GGDEF)-like protein
MSAVLIWSLLVVSGLEPVASWKLMGANPLQQTAWGPILFSVAILLCSALTILTLFRRRRLARGRQWTELSLERLVEDRARALRQEIEDRQRAEQLNRGQTHVLEMLADPGNLTTEEILQSLAEVVASRNQGWESSIFLVERRGRVLSPVASSEVHARMQRYLKSVGTDYPDSPECQAAVSGEIHIVEHLPKVDLPWTRPLVESGIFSVWSVPFCANGSGRLTGVLTVYARSRSGPTALELEMVESAARLAALVIEHRRIRQDLLDNAYQDAMTGLPNRRAGEQALETAIERARLRGESLAVLWIDINRFKRLNDHHGHAAGDHVLRVLAERLRRHPLCTGTVARMGEDEFLVLVPGAVHQLDSFEIARRLSAAIAKPIHCKSTRIDVSASIGACVYPKDGSTSLLLARNADFAMFRAKNVGEPFCVFSAAMSEEASEALEIEEGLRVALEKNYLRLVYQPLYTTEGDLTGFEALLRFDHPQLGVVSPARFIPIAEETRLIVPIGNWVLREACRQLKAWMDAGLPRVRMGVNISALQFARDDFSDSVARVVTDCGLDPELLTLELTESVVMEDYAAVVRQMNLLRQCGAHIAMDDFGTGYSSLSYLHRIPVDMLKIDRSFVEKLTEPEGTRPIVEAVISLAQRLGLTIVAEGVETREQQAILEKAGCHEFQGFLFARPMIPADAEKCLHASRTYPFAQPTQADEDGVAVA